MGTTLTVLLVAVAAFVVYALLFTLVIALRRPPVVARAVVADPDDRTLLDESGAVRSTQGANITMPDEVLERVWTAEYLERLANTYWRFLTRITLGIVRVHHGESERAIVAVTWPFVLLRFRAPEYETGPSRGVVRWRIKDGLLVSRRGRDRDGYLQIDVSRAETRGEPGEATIRVEVEVANFYPSIASRISTRFYTITQSRIHVLVTYAFLRSLARGDLARSRVRRFREP